MRKLKTDGFTIIELMIATAVFATVLLLCALGLLQIGRAYYKGVTTSRTQEAARSIMDDVSQTIQFSGGELVDATTATDGQTRGYCIGNKLYSYVLDRQIVNNERALTVSSIDSCSSPPQAQPLVSGGSITGREMLSTRMRLAKFDVDPMPGTDGLYSVTVRVVSGDTDVLNATHDSCASGRAGTQFCAVSELSTVVQKRVR